MAAWPKGFFSLKVLAVDFLQVQRRLPTIKETRPKAFNNFNQINNNNDHGFSKLYVKFPDVFNIIQDCEVDCWKGSK